MATIQKNVPVMLGMITFPVAVVSATTRPESLNTICNQGHEPAKTRMRLYCPTCDSDDRSAFVKGKAVGDEIIVIDEAKLEALAPPDDVKNTLTLTCHPVTQMGGTLVPGEKAYYLKAEKGADQGYALLVELIRSRTDVAFVTEWAARTAASFYRVAIFGDALGLVELARPDTVVDTPAAPSVPIQQEMLDLANTFVDKVTTDYDPAAYRDVRSEAIAALLEDGDSTIVAPAATKTSNPNDLMAMLQAAVGTAA